MTQLFELTPAESMFAPFHDPVISEHLPLRLEPGSAVELKRIFGWDGVKLSWETARPGTLPAWKCRWPGCPRALINLSSAMSRQRT